MIDQIHKEKIIAEFKEVSSAKELAKLLNKTQVLLHGDKGLMISEKSLNYYSSDKFCPNRYRVFQIKKKNGSDRIINAPVNGLKSIQKSISDFLQVVYPIHPSAFGFVPLKNVADNALLHVGREYVYNIDLKDFFHSFSRIQVKYALLDNDLNILSNEKIAFLVAGLCTFNISKDQDLNLHVLPQGSPTSPVLTNILCRHLDRKLSGLAKRFNATYSRYADDITFSAEINIFQIKEFKDELKRIICDSQKFEIQEAKTRIQHKSFRQEVTGIVVNQKLNVTKRYIKNVRMYLYLIERYGLEKATLNYVRDTKKDRPNKSVESINLRNILNGKIQYLRMVRGKEDSVSKGLEKRFLKAFDIKSKITKAKPSELDEILNILLKQGIDEAMKLYLKN
jgi:retron-type reverse transcriptase